MDPKLLIIGHSHVSCIRGAAQAANASNVEAIVLSTAMGKPPEDVTKTIDEALGSVTLESPDAVCLCLWGNHHNVLGIVEHPEPFSVGDERAGSMPLAAEGRWFIPYQVMLSAFQEALKGYDTIAMALYDKFPGALRLYLNSPPPIRYWEHIKKYPGAFKSMLDLGPMPNGLKRHLFRIQSEVLREISTQCKAEFIETVPKAVDNAGFLRRIYSTNDPTHGNSRYGEAALELLLTKSGGRT